MNYLSRGGRKVRKYGPYALIIIDPPSFQKGSFALTKDYQKILKLLWKSKKLWWKTNPALADQGLVAVRPFAVESFGRLGEEARSSGATPTTS